MKFVLVLVLDNVYLVIDNGYFVHETYLLSAELW